MLNLLSALGRVTGQVVAGPVARGTGFQAMFGAATEVATGAGTEATDGPASAAPTADPRSALIGGLGALRQQALSIATLPDGEGQTDNPNPALNPTPGQDTDSGVLPGLVRSLAVLVAGFDRETGSGLIAALRTGLGPVAADGLPTAADPAGDPTETLNGALQALVAVIGFVERTVQAMSSPARTGGVSLQVATLQGHPLTGAISLAGATEGVPAGAPAIAGGAGTVLTEAVPTAAIASPDGVPAAAGRLPGAMQVGTAREAIGKESGHPVPAGAAIRVDPSAALRLGEAPRAEPAPRAGLKGLTGLVPEAATAGKATGEGSGHPVPAGAAIRADLTAALRPGEAAGVEPAPRAGVTGSVPVAAKTGDTTGEVALPGENPGRAKARPLLSAATGRGVETVVVPDKAAQPRLPRADAPVASIQGAGGDVKPILAQTALSAANAATLAEEAVRAGAVPAPKDARPSLPRDAETVVLAATGVPEPKRGARPTTAAASVTDPRLAPVPQGSSGGNDMAPALLGQVVAQAIRVLQAGQERGAEPSWDRPPEADAPLLPEFLTRTLPGTDRPVPTQAGNASAPVRSHFAEVLTAQIRAAEVTEGRTVIELSPRGLGQIEVDIRTEADGSLKVMIRAENTAVLNTLRDARDLLAQSIGAAGGGVLDFQEGSPGQDRGGHGTAGIPGISGEEDATAAAAEPESAPDVIGGGQLDIMT